MLAGKKKANVAPAAPALVAPAGVHKQTRIGSCVTHQLLYVRRPRISENQAAQEGQTVHGKVSTLGAYDAVKSTSASNKTITQSVVHLLFDTTAATPKQEQDGNQ